jgi:phage tail protein X
MSRFLRHVCGDGQRWDSIAYRYYGDALAYERVVAANPQVPIVPALPAGTVLLIPVAEAPDVIAGEDLPPWKR